LLWEKAAGKEGINALWYKGEKKKMAELKEREGVVQRNHPVLVVLKTRVFATKRNYEWGKAICR